MFFRKPNRGEATVLAIILALTAVMLMFPLIQYIECKQNLHLISQNIKDALEDMTVKVSVSQYDVVKQGGRISAIDLTDTYASNITDNVMQNIGFSNLSAEKTVWENDKKCRITILSVQVNASTDTKIKFRYTITQPKAVLGIADINESKTAYCVMADSCHHEAQYTANQTEFYSGDVFCGECGKKVKQGNYIVPDGSTLYIKESSGYSTVTAGSVFPATIPDASYIDYGQYRYYWNAYALPKTIQNATVMNPSINGWNAVALDYNRRGYQTVMTEVGGKPVTGLCYTYAGCNRLSSAVAIPNTITHMRYTFAGCTSFAGTSSLSIPDGVITMNGAFMDCSKFNVALTIPDNVCSMQQAFMNCSALVKAPYVEEGNTALDMWQAYRNCPALTKANIPLRATDIRGLFAKDTADSTILGVSYAGAAIEEIANRDGWDMNCYLFVTLGSDGK